MFSAISLNNLELSTNRFVLRPITSNEAYKVLDYYKRNQVHYNLSIYDAAKEFYTLGYQVEKLLIEEELAVEGNSIRLFIFEKSDLSFNNILGDVCLFDILYNLKMCATLSYKIDKNHTNKGIAVETSQELCNFAFAKLNLHKLKAYIRPNNLASVQVADKLGFSREALIKDYIFLNQKWHDHLLYSKLNDK